MNAPMIATVATTIMTHTMKPACHGKVPASKAFRKPLPAASWVAMTTASPNARATRRVVECEM